MKDKAEIRTSVMFAIKEGSVGIEWFYDQNVPDLTPEQANVIALSNLSRAAEKIADALNNIAVAIRETSDPDR